MHNEIRQLRFEIIKLSKAQRRVEKTIGKCIDALECERSPLDSVDMTLRNRLNDLEYIVSLYYDEFS